MPDNHDLDYSVLQLVFRYLSNDTRHKYYVVDEFRQLLPLVAVCRSWRNSTLPQLYKVAYLAPDYSRRATTSLWKELYYMFSYGLGVSEPLWLSNIGLINSLNYNHFVKKLQISYNCSYPIFRIPSVLDSFGFNSYSSWLSITHFTIVEGRDRWILRSNLRGRSAELAGYFARYIPNVHCFRHFLYGDELDSSFIANLNSTYFKQVYGAQKGSHDAYGLPKGKELCDVDLTLGVGDYVQKSIILPNELVSKYQSLTLYDLPLDFGWKPFDSGLLNRIEFSDLISLRLYFRPDTIDARLVKDVISTRGNSVQTYPTLLFPKLQALELWNFRHADTSFYSAFEHAPLKSLSISGSFDAIKNINTSMLLNISQLSIDICITAFITTSISRNIYTAASRLDSDPYNGFKLENGFEFSEYSGLLLFICNLFDLSLSVKVATISVFSYDLPLSLPENIGWLNLRELTMRADTSASSIIQLATQCPELNRLSVEYIADDIVEIAEALNNMLFQGPKSGLCVKSKLEYLRVADIKRNRGPQSSLKSLIYVALAVQSTKELAVSVKLVAPLEDLIAEYSRSFPHLRKVKVYN